MRAKCPYCKHMSNMVVLTNNETVRCLSCGGLTTITQMCGKRDPYWDKVQSAKMTDKVAVTSSERNWTSCGGEKA